MTDKNQPIVKLIPASLLRVRCFLNTEGRMKVKPWATADETLDAFYDSLATNRDNDAFWNGLQSLLAILSADIKQRTAARRDELVDNELLDSERQQQLLSEIRHALAGQKRGRGGFRKLTLSLSPPAIGLLVVLGSAASQGCDTTETTRIDTDAARLPVGDSGAADVRPGDTGKGTGGAQANDSGILPRDSAVDAAKTKSDTDASAPDACIRKDITIAEIINSCITYEPERKEIQACVDALNDSWRTGLEELFRCDDCSDISRKLGSCLSRSDKDTCSNPQDAGEFDRDTFLDNCAVNLYLGVRFE